jgi:hypothetical protein
MQKPAKLSFKIAMLLVLLMGTLTSIPRLEFLAYPLTPGMFIAAIVLPTGPHSGWPVLYLVLTGVIDVCLFTAVIEATRSALHRRRGVSTAGRQP